MHIDDDFLVLSGDSKTAKGSIPPDPDLPTTVEYMKKAISAHDRCRAFYDDFAALDAVRKVLGSRTDLSLVDEQWVGVLRMMIDTLTRLRKVIGFHQTRISFEKVLKHYRRYRQELEDEIKNPSNSGGSQVCRSNAQPVRQTW